MRPDNSLRLAKVSCMYMDIGISPYGASGAGEGGTAGSATTGGTFMCKGGGGTVVAGVVKGPASEGIFHFFKRVPL